MTTRLPSRRCQRGQSLVEYALIGGLLVLAMFVPEYGGKTAAQYLADMVKGFFQTLSLFLSLP